METISSHHTVAIAHSETLAIKVLAKDNSWMHEVRIEPSNYDQGLDVTINRISGDATGQVQIYHYGLVLADAGRGDNHLRLIPPVPQKDEQE